MKIETELNDETALKLKRRAERHGMTPEEVVRRIAKGEQIFLAEMVGATKCETRR